jgi:hypothetical protein
MNLIGCVCNFFATDCIISFHADVAELVDAQVSEACDGDIVEVQVLSSAPAIFGSASIPDMTGDG